MIERNSSSKFQFINLAKNWTNGLVGRIGQVRSTAAALSFLAFSIPQASLSDENLGSGILSRLEKFVGYQGPECHMFWPDSKITNMQASQFRGFGWCDSRKTLKIEKTLENTFMLHAAYLGVAQEGSVQLSPILSEYSIATAADVRSQEFLASILKQLDRCSPGEACFESVARERSSLSIEQTQSYLEKFAKLLTSDEIDLKEYEFVVLRRLTKSYMECLIDAWRGEIATTPCDPGRNSQMHDVGDAMILLHEDHLLLVHHLSVIADNPESDVFDFALIQATHDE